MVFVVFCIFLICSMFCCFACLFVRLSSPINWPMELWLNIDFHAIDFHAIMFMVTYFCPVTALAVRLLLYYSPPSALKKFCCR